MLLLAIILFGMIVGAGAQLILGRSRGRIDWTMAIVAGLVGSFVGGLIFNLLAGNGFEFHITGLIGSILGAIVVLALYGPIRKYIRPAPVATPTKNTALPEKRKNR